MITIKASFNDTIERILHHKTYKPCLTKEIILDPEEVTKEHVIKCLQECHSYRIGNEVLLLIVDRTEEEINESIIRNEVGFKSNINQLKKWMNANDDYRTQILNYLQFKELDWIIDELM